MNDDEQLNFVKLVNGVAHNYRLHTELEALNQMDYQVGYGHVGIGWQVQNRTGDLKRTTWMDDWTAKYGEKNPLYEYDHNAPMVNPDKPFPMPATEKDGALIYHRRMINLQRASYPPNETLNQIKESKATKLCLYGTRFSSPRDFQEFMCIIPMTVTELVIHHTGVFGEVEVASLVKVLRRPTLKAIELKIRLLDASLIEAIRDNPSITSLVLEQPYRDDKKVNEAILTLVSRKIIGKWQRFEYYPEYHMDTLTMSEYVRLLKYAPELKRFGLNMDRTGFKFDESAIGTFFKQLAKSKVEGLVIRCPSGNYAVQVLEAIRQMKHLKDLTISGDYWVDLSMVFVLQETPKLERIWIDTEDHHLTANRLRLWSSSFKWPLQHVGFLVSPMTALLGDCVHPNAVQALNRIKMQHRIAQVLGQHYYYTDRPLIHIDLMRVITSFIL